MCPKFLLFLVAWFLLLTTHPHSYDASLPSLSGMMSGNHSPGPLVNLSSAQNILNTLSVSVSVQDSVSFVDAFRSSIFAPSKTCMSEDLVYFSPLPFLIDLSMMTGCCFLLIPSPHVLLSSSQANIQTIPQNALAFFPPSSNMYRAAQKLKCFIDFLYSVCTTPRMAFPCPLFSCGMSCIHLMLAPSLQNMKSLYADYDLFGGPKRLPYAEGSQLVTLPEKSGVCVCVCVFVTRPLLFGSWCIVGRHSKSTVSGNSVGYSKRQSSRHLPPTAT